MFRRFFSYYARYKRLFFLDFGCAVLAGLLELGFPLAVKLFVDELLPGRDWGLIAAVAAALLAIYAINTALSAVVNYWAMRSGSRSSRICAARLSITSRSCRSAISTTTRPAT